MRLVATAFGALFVVVYPLLVYGGLTRYDTRQVVLLLAGVIGLKLALDFLSMPAGARQQFGQLLKVPLPLLPIFGLAFVLRDSRYLLATPVLINAALLVSFGASLAGPTPIAERFARLQVADLSAQEIAYCRHVTIAWCVFFVLNGALAAALALIAPLAWWAFYTGIVAYVLMGALFAVEYLVRKRRFGRYGDGPVDRLVRTVLGQQATE